MLQSKEACSQKETPYRQWQETGKKEKEKKN
jgi:hypothetical protein